MVFLGGVKLKKSIGTQPDFSLKITLSVPKVTQGDKMDRVPDRGTIPRNFVFH
jgi:hypothetical protein